MLQAPAAGIQAPRLPFPLHLEIEGFTLLNYPVTPARLRGQVPRGWELATTPGEEGEVAWLSLFVGHNVLRRVGALPALPLSFHQLDYRTYVRVEGGHALFIFRSIVGSDLYAEGLRRYPGFPAEPQPFLLCYEAHGARLRGLEASVGVMGRELQLEVWGRGEPPEHPGFPDVAAAMAFLADVPDAYFPSPEGGLGRMISPHPPLVPLGADVRRLEAGYLVAAGLLTAAEARRPAIRITQGRLPFPLYC